MTIIRPRNDRTDYTERGSYMNRCDLRSYRLIKAPKVEKDKIEGGPFSLMQTTINHRIMSSGFW